MFVDVDVAIIVEGVDGFFAAVRWFLDTAFCLLRISVLNRWPVTSVADTAPPPSSKVHQATKPLLLVLLIFEFATAAAAAPPPLSAEGGGGWGSVSVSRSKSLCMLSTISMELR